MIRTVEVVGEDIPTGSSPACRRMGDGRSLALGSAIAHGASYGHLTDTSGYGVFVAVGQSSTPVL